MRAGKMRHRITLQRPVTDTQNETDWQDVSTVWSEIVSLSVREQFMAAQQHGSATHSIRTRYLPALAGIDASWRILFGSRIFVMAGLPQNIDEGNREYRFLVLEGLREV